MSPLRCQIVLHECCLPAVRSPCHNVPRFRQNCVGTSKTFLGGGRFRIGEAPPKRVFSKITSGRTKPFWVEAAFALGKHHPFGFSAKSRQDGKNLFGWKPLLRWASTTQTGFRQNRTARMPIARRFIRLASTAGTAQSVFRRRPVSCRRRTGAAGRRESPGIVRSAPAALFRSRT